MHWIFISYRRDDVAQEARALRDAIEREFGEKAAFFDTDIRGGDTWPVEIQGALSKCHVVLAVIGPNWIRTANEWGQRRLDDKSDWVRQELSTALEQQKRLLPVCVDGAKLPPAQVLPEPLRPLLTRQALEIRRDFWDHDVKLVLAQLQECRAGENGAHDELGPYPVMQSVPPSTIDPAALERILRTQLASWREVSSPLPEDPSKTRVELFKEYKFPTFRDAVRFMRLVAPGCDIADHHPRWENIYRTLRVHLTTWGIGHRITDRDVQLARYLDEAYAHFERRSRS